MHDTVIAPGGTDLDVDVRNLTRVEGEGSLRLRVRGGVVESAKLEIFEAPRYFERLVVGRTIDEVIDIVARICGICPVAYQMTAVHAVEARRRDRGRPGRPRPPSAALLRRVDREPRPAHLLAALPGLPGLPERARPGPRPPDAVEAWAAAEERRQRDRRELIGGRAIHPVSVRVGGFSRVRPSRRDPRPARRPRGGARHRPRDHRPRRRPPTADVRREARLVALRHAADYPMNHGRIVSNDGLDIPATAGRRCSRRARWLVARAPGRRARRASPIFSVRRPGSPLTRTSSTRARPRRWRAPVSATDRGAKPYRSIVARAVELVHAVAEAIDIIDAYEPPASAIVPGRPGRRRGMGDRSAARPAVPALTSSTSEGRVPTARIVPPTSQNQAAIEADLALFAPTVLDRPTGRDDPSARAADPELRPLHQLCHALPRSAGGGPVMNTLLDVEPVVRRPGLVEPLDGIDSTPQTHVEVLACGAPDRGDDGAAADRRGTARRRAAAGRANAHRRSARHRRPAGRAEGRWRRRGRHRPWRRSGLDRRDPLQWARRTGSGDPAPFVARPVDPRDDRGRLDHPRTSAAWVASSPSAASISAWERR